jgi:hypothetical protein
MCFFYILLMWLIFFIYVLDLFLDILFMFIYIYISFFWTWMHVRIYCTCHVFGCNRYINSCMSNKLCYNKQHFKMISKHDFDRYSLEANIFLLSDIWFHLESTWTPWIPGGFHGLQVDSMPWTPKYAIFIGLHLDSTWTPWSSCGICGVHLESMGECKLHQFMD